MSYRRGAVYVVIVGAGEVGSYLARYLISEKHDVAIVELDDRVAQSIEGNLDCLVVRGSGIDHTALQQAGIAKAYLVLAVTEVDEVNLITCMVANRVGDDPRTVARVRASEYLMSQSALNADYLGLSRIVGPERAVAEKVVRLVEYDGPGAMRLFADGRIALLELPLGEDSPFVHETLSALGGVLGDQSIVCAVRGQDGLRIPRGDDQLSVDERAYVMTVPDSVDMFMILSGKPWHQVRHVLIVGCGTIGFHLAKELEARRLYPKIIEADPQRADWVTKHLTKSIVLCGDGTDPEFLREELDETADAVVVLLEDDEKAMMVGLFAKHVGAKKVIVRSDKPAYAPIAHKLGVDALISPQSAVAEAILEFIHGGQVSAAGVLGDREGEILQLRLREGCRVVNKALKDIDFPKGALVGAVIRDGTVTIASGATQLLAGDEVVVVAALEVIPAVEKLLS